MGFFSIRFWNSWTKHFYNFTYPCITPVLNDKATADRKVEVGDDAK
jgi:hypothetical protein